MPVAPVEEPEVIPHEAPEPISPQTEPRPDLDPYAPDWPDGRPEPQPKALHL